MEAKRAKFEEVEATRILDGAREGCVGECAQSLQYAMLTVGPVHTRRRAYKGQADRGIVCGRKIITACDLFRRSHWEKSNRLGMMAQTVKPIHTSRQACKE
jgi:hypothetical protein